MEFMERNRCTWAGEEQIYQAYHDEEWGVPIHEDRKLFEFLVLEGAQAGLSWITVLRKRETYRAAFRGFDPAVVAHFDEKEVGRLLADPGIVRNRLKVQSAITNARAFLEVQREFGSFDRYAWGFVDGKTISTLRDGSRPLPATTPESDAFSQDLRKRGFKFVGSTLVYAFMQACGLVDDHTTECFKAQRTQDPLPG